ncbi:hypothetical protein AMTRI_Chr07g31470 [Amborella trichopoda]
MDPPPLDDESSAIRDSSGPILSHRSPRQQDPSLSPLFSSSRDENGEINPKQTLCPDPTFNSPKEAMGSASQFIHPNQPNEISPATTLHPMLLSPITPIPIPLRILIPPLSEVPFKINSRPSTPWPPPSEGSTLSPYSSRLSPTRSLSHSVTSVDSTFFHDLLRAQVNGGMDNLLAFGVNFDSGLPQPLTPRPFALNHSTSATPSQLPSCSRRTHTSSFSQ